MYTFHGGRTPSSLQVVVIEQILKVCRRTGKKQEKKKHKNKRAGSMSSPLLPPACRQQKHSQS
ncbi:hypothetical protein EYF80_042682 [Liparis tanakae]|uniref:Uncharacterized protein n=1 Tax=Liparis tanakae TaxID=230148 RepID=A0A4Z2G0N3_9TELE|nr:hypothetical protein EYF80_042682 [Liparis tanakae]